MHFPVYAHHYYIQQYLLLQHYAWLHAEVQLQCRYVTLDILNHQLKCAQTIDDKFLPDYF